MRVKLKNVLPNPYRHIDSYPIRKEKVEALKASIGSTDWWANVVARKAPGKNGCIEIAYGHHRLAALRELYKPNDEFDFRVVTLSNDRMLKMMAAENDEAFDGAFWLVLESVRSLLEAHVRGEIVGLQVEYQGGHGHIHLADLLPKSFGLPAAETWVTPIAIGRYYQWMRSEKSEDGERPQQKVLTALNAVRLIVGGHATVSQFRSVGNKQALAVVREAAVAERKAKQDIKRDTARVKVADKAIKEAKTKEDREAAKTVKRELDARVRDAKRRLETEPKAAAQAASTSLAKGEGYVKASKAARAQVSSGYDPFGMPPEINKATEQITRRIDKIMYAPEDKTTFTEKLVQIASHSEHLDEDVRYGLTRALRAAAHRFEMMADRVEVLGKKVTKPELRKLGVKS